MKEIFTRIEQLKADYASDLIWGVRFDVAGLTAGHIFRASRIWVDNQPTDETRMKPNTQIYWSPDEDTALTEITKRLGLDRKSLVRLALRQLDPSFPQERRMAARGPGVPLCKGYDSRRPVKS